MTLEDIFGCLEDAAPVLKDGEGYSFSFAIQHKIVIFLCKEQIRFAGCGQIRNAVAGIHHCRPRLIGMVDEVFAVGSDGQRFICKVRLQ